MFIISLWLSVVISREGKEISLNSESQGTYYLRDIIKMDYCTPCLRWNNFEILTISSKLYTLKWSSVDITFTQNG